MYSVRIYHTSKLMYNGKTKLVLKYLGFLKEHGMEFKFQSFSEYKGFSGPIDTYSFYNQNGCFTMHNIVQRNEWNWFVSKSFSENQYKLLEKEISQNLYITKRYWLYSRVLSELSNLLKFEILSTGAVFGIKL